MKSGATALVSGKLLGQANGSGHYGRFLHFSARDIRRNARRNGPAQPIALIVARQALAETRLKLLKNIDFRHRRNRDACRAYCAMEGGEFENINARQAWANWRSIPRNLSGRLPSRAVNIIDLCSGTGQSSAVLAFYAPAGSSVLGLEYNAEFVEMARRRTYRHGAGGGVTVTFRAQSVLDPFQAADGTPIPDASIDVVNASGAVGCHFDAAATATLAQEVRRVLKPSGLALIDAGSSGTSPDEVCGIFEACGFTVVNRAKSCVFDRYTQLCMQKI